jgi:hypothetical protein
VLLLIISVVSILSYREASAKDMNMLVDTLVSNFLAQQVSTICSAGDRQFDSETSGALGDAGRYAERVRQEVVTGFSSDEATEIISKAASKARDEALLIAAVTPLLRADMMCVASGRDDNVSSPTLPRKRTSAHGQITDQRLPPEHCEGGLRYCVTTRDRPVPILPRHKFHHDPLLQYPDCYFSNAPSWWRAVSRS